MNCHLGRSYHVHITY